MQSSIFSKIIKLILIVVTALLVSSLLCAIVAGGVDPRETVWLQFFAMAIPFIYLALCFVLIIWILLWHRTMIFVSLGVLLATSFSVGGFVQLEWGKKYPGEKKTAEELTLVSYNTHCMGNFDDSKERLSEICNRLDSLDSDIICFQEFMVRDSSELAIVDELFDKYAYRIYQKNPTESLSGYTGRIILSKYPLSRRRNYNSGDYGSGFTSCDMVHLGDTIRIFNCHLQTTGFNKINKEQSVMKFLEGDSTKIQSQKTASIMAENFRERAAQADTLSQKIESFKNGVLVIGDFNATPMSYTYETIKGDLSDAFRDAGDGYGSTYREMGGFFRIDYVLYNSSLYECESYQSPDWTYSDHKPVIVTLKKI
ncbi:MAG: endonuclease/exonuclease/phosphatase family protein [Rikenellaceae bacterium]